MRSLKVLLSHSCPYPLCHSLESPRKNVQAQKAPGMKISQRRDSRSHLIFFFFLRPPYFSTPASNYIITSPSALSLVTVLSPSKGECLKQREPRKERIRLDMPSMRRKARDG